MTDTDKFLNKKTNALYDSKWVLDKTSVLTGGMFAMTMTWMDSWNFTGISDFNARYFWGRCVSCAKECKMMLMRSMELVYGVSKLFLTKEKGIW